jgi:hypothetical protein
MALNSTRLKNALKPKIESYIRSFILEGDATPYPNLTEFSGALAQAIAEEVVTELTTNAVVTVSVPSVSVSAGTFTAGVTPVTGTGTTATTNANGTVA